MNRARLLFLATLLGLLGTLAGGGRADAAPLGDAPPGSKEVTFQVVDRKGTRDTDDDEPAVGAVITVVDADGVEVAEVETDEDGRAVAVLPGSGTYTATLDLDSLTEGLGLPREGGEVLTIDPDRNRTPRFNLGERQRETTSDLSRLPQLIFNGLNFGLIIAITSVGLSLIFGTTGLVNFSHGEHVTWGAIVAWWINASFGMHLVPAAILAVLIGGLSGALMDRILWRPLRTRGLSLVAMMIVSIGLSLAARNLFQLFFGEVFRPYHDYNVQIGIDIGPIRTAPKSLWAIGIILVVLVATASLLQFTRIGKAMRAVSDNPDLAASSGINVDRVIQFVWFLGGSLAALGGILFGIQQQVHFEMGFRLLLLMFAGVTLGGLGTAYGALVGSFVVGMFIEVSTIAIPTELKNVGALAVLIVVLLFRPQGILGRAERIG